MRNEFYGDWKDVPKWSVVLDACGRGEHNRSIFYVPMLRPDQAHNPMQPVGPWGEKVLTFFRAEAAAFAGGVPRDICRIRPLMQQLGKTIDVFEFSRGYYTHGQRQAYFNGVVGLLNARPPNRRDVVLIDPDAGIEPQNVTHAHVCCSQLTAVWHAMRRGDVLVLFQNQFRKAGWQKVRCSTLAAAICDHQPIRLHDFGPVCFYETEMYPFSPLQQDRAK